MAKKPTDELPVTEVRFDKKQLLSSARFGGHKDLLSALLDDERMYTDDEVKTMIEEFKNRRIE